MRPLIHVVKSVLSIVVGVPLVIMWMAVVFAAIILLFWLVGGGGIFDVLGALLHTIVDTIEAGFKHNWKLAEVALVLLVLYLIVRKR